MVLGGGIMCMDVSCVWMCYVYVCVMYMDVLCIWMCYVYGCVMYMEDEDMEDEEEEEEEEGGGGRRGCIQNEYPHIKEWWEKKTKMTKKIRIFFLRILRALCARLDLVYIYIYRFRV